MNTFICFVINFILVYGYVSAGELNKKLQTDDETKPNDNPKSRFREMSTKLANDDNKSDERLEKSPYNTENDTDKNVTTPNSGDLVTTEPLSDFDDLEYGRAVNNDEDDFIDEEKFATELNKDKKSRKMDEVPSVKAENQFIDEVRIATEFNKDEILAKMNSYPSALVPVIDSTVRSGATQKFKMDGTDRSESSSNENSSREFDIERRMFDSGLRHHVNKFAPHSSQFGTVPNSLYLFGHNYRWTPSQPYHSTPYPPGTNGFDAQFRRSPIEQNRNPYNYEYINRSPKRYEYPNSYDTSNSYPYIGHANKDTTSFIPYSSGQRLVPGFFYSYNNPLGKNFGTQSFGQGKVF